MENLNAQAASSDPKLPLATVRFWPKSDRLDQKKPAHFLGPLTAKSGHKDPQLNHLKSEVQPASYN